MPFIIAEIGSCHNHDKTQMCSFLDRCVALNVFAVKFQYWSDAEKFASLRKKVEASEVYEKAKTSLQFLEVMKRECVNRGLQMGVSVFLKEDVDKINGLCDFFKVASLESQCRFLIDEMTRLDRTKPIFISTGCCVQEEVVRLLYLRNEFQKEGKNPIRLLHCVTSYPAPLEEMNLRLMQRGAYDGLSDHTNNTITGAIATALGAQYIEVHVRHERTVRTSPDYDHSLPPEAFSYYVHNCYNAAKMLGSDAFREPTPSEVPYLSMKRDRF